MDCIRYKIQIRDFIHNFFSGFHMVVIFSNIILLEGATMYSSVFCFENDCVIKTVQANIHLNEWDKFNFNLESLKSCW